jgi:hypothetical protein
VKKAQTPGTGPIAHVVFGPALIIDRWKPCCEKTDGRDQAGLKTRLYGCRDVLGCRDIHDVVEGVTLEGFPAGCPD